MFNRLSGGEDQDRSRLLQSSTEADQEVRQPSKWRQHRCLLSLAFVTCLALGAICYVCIKFIWPPIITEPVGPYQLIASHEGSDFFAQAEHTDITDHVTDMNGDVVNINEYQATLTFITEDTSLFQPATEMCAIQNCVVFSCSPQDYFLVEIHWLRSNTSCCDRYHFFGSTALARNQNITVAPNWCRVGLLEDAFAEKGKLGVYDTIIYVDVDVVFDEAAFLRNANAERNWVISYKMFQGETIMRTSSFILPNRNEAMYMIKNWGKYWRNVHLQDQTVFNELFSCNMTGMHCLNIMNQSIKATYGEKEHCGSWLSIGKRKDCMSGK